MLEQLIGLILGKQFIPMLKGNSNNFNQWFTFGKWHHPSQEEWDSSESSIPLNKQSFRNDT